MPSIKYYSLHHRHLLIACESALLIVDTHGSELLRHKQVTMCVTSFLYTIIISGTSWAPDTVGGWVNVKVTRGVIS